VLATDPDEARFEALARLREEAVPPDIRRQRAGGSSQG